MPPKRGTNIYWLSHRLGTRKPLRRLTVRSCAGAAGMDPRSRRARTREFAWQVQFKTDSEVGQHSQHDSTVCMPMQDSTSRMAHHVANRSCAGKVTGFAAVAHACLPMNRAAHLGPWIAEAVTRKPVVRCYGIAPAHDTDFVVGSLCGSRGACRGQHARRSFKRRGARRCSERRCAAAISAAASCKVAARRFTCLSVRPNSPGSFPDQTSGRIRTPDRSPTRRTGRTRKGCSSTVREGSSQSKDQRSQPAAIAAGRPGCAARADLVSICRSPDRRHPQSRQAHPRTSSIATARLSATDTFAASARTSAIRPSWPDTGGTDPVATTCTNAPISSA